MADNTNPKKIDKKVFLSLILAAGTLLYLVAVLWIGFGSITHVREINAKAKAESSSTQNNSKEGTKTTEIPQPYPISEYIEQVLLVIGTALATHLGAYLGISITQGAGRDSVTNISDWFSYLFSTDGLPGLLAFVYFFTLLAAIVFWAITGFSEYAGKPLQDLSYSFLGVFAGAMAALSKA